MFRSINSEKEVDNLVLQPLKLIRSHCIPNGITNVVPRALAVVHHLISYTTPTHHRGFIYRLLMKSSVLSFITDNHSKVVIKTRKYTIRYSIHIRLGWVWL